MMMWRENGEDEENKCEFNARRPNGERRIIR